VHGDVWIFLSSLASLGASAIGGLVLWILVGVRRDIVELRKQREEDQRRCSEVHREIAEDIGRLKGRMNSYENRAQG